MRGRVRSWRPSARRPPEFRSPGSRGAARSLARRSPVPTPGGVVLVMSPGLALRQVGSRGYYVALGSHGARRGGLRRAELALRKPGPGPPRLVRTAPGPSRTGPGFSSGSSRTWSRSLPHPILPPAGSARSPSEPAGLLPRRPGAAAWTRGEAVSGLPPGSGPGTLPPAPAGRGAPGPRPQDRREQDRQRRDEDPHGYSDEARPRPGGEDDNEPATWGVCADRMDDRSRERGRAERSCQCRGG